MLVGDYNSVDLTKIAHILYRAVLIPCIHGNGDIINSCSNFYMLNMNVLESEHIAVSF
jgi:hypothetical protein